MAGSSLLALIDDIATLLDDISIYSKIAAKKTAGVLGDDLALNAEQVTGIKADRELPVVWAVAKGAFINKLILVPVALLISAIMPWLVVLLLMIGGAYLCFEGFEKVFHKFLHSKNESEERHQNQINAIKDKSVNLLEFEKKKIKGAIRTDFILSAEIIVLTLGAVKSAEFVTQIGVLTTIAIAVTIVVYGLVAAIVKLDDAGLYLLATEANKTFSNIKHQSGRIILIMAPYLMKALSVVGTVAMFLVGGGIIAHNIPLLHHAVDVLSLSSLEIPAVGSLFSSSVPVFFNFITGLLVGLCVFLVLKIIGIIMSKLK